MKRFLSRLCWTIFLLEGFRSSGMLEDLCLNSVQGDLLSCINAFFECTNSTKIEQMSKARVQTYLATKPETVKSLGVGAAKGYWNFEHECFSEFAKFLKNFS